MFSLNKRFKNTICFGLCLILLTTVIQPHRVLAEGNTLIVGPGEAYTDIQTAVDAAKPGDTVLIQDGKYNGTINVNVSGTEETPITIKAIGENAELFGNINISGRWIRLEGLHLTAYSDGILWKEGERCVGISVTGSHIEVVKNTIYHAYTYGIECADASSYILISENHLLETSAGIVANGDNNTYEYNEIEAIGNYAPMRGADVDFFRVFGKNVVVRGNYCHGIIKGEHLGGSHVDFVQVYDDNRYESQNVLIENNIVDSFFHQGFMMENDAYPSEKLIRDWTIRNNIVSGYTSWGVCGGKIGGEIPNLVVENNLFIGSPDGAYYGIYLSGINGYGSVRNNIIYNGGNYGCDMGTTLFDSGNNLIYSDKEGIKTPDVNDSNDITGMDPCFADATNGNYRLRSNSPAIDAGMAVDFTYDLDGSSRTQGERTDIGPYEFAGIKDNTAAVRIAIDKESLLMDVGSSEQISASVYPINTTDKSIIWESSQPSVASVDSNGTITAISVGDVVITARTEGTSVTDSLEVSVQHLPELRAVSFSPAVVEFDQEIFEYDVEVPYNFESITLISEFVAGSVTVNGIELRSGIPSDKIPLNLGENVIKMIFSDEDGTQNLYTFRLTRVSKRWWKASEGFSSTQGENGWYYLYQRLSDGAMLNLQWSDTYSRWQHSTQYSAGISRGQQSPDSSQNSVRAWKAPMDGKVTITGAPTKVQSYGKYCSGWIQKNDMVIWEPQHLEYMKPVFHDVTVEVKEGDLIYFIVKRELSASSNSVEWDPTITMAINGKPTEKVTLNQKVLSLETETGHMLVASVYPKDGLNQDVIWNTSNAAIAKVNELGVVTAVSEGTVIITASVRGTVLSDTCTVKVVDHFDRWIASEGFGDTQGENQWYYYSYMEEDIYTEMKWSETNQAWQSITKGNKSSITSQNQNPSAYNGPVRAWEAPEDGMVTIVGDMLKISPYYLFSTLTIKKNDKTLFGPYTISDGKRHHHDVSTYVKKGDIIYFIAATDTRGVIWDPVITYLPITLTGDMNGDGKIDIVDLAYIARNIDKTSESEDWESIKNADMNSDGNISIVDLSSVARLIQ